MIAAASYRPRPTKRRRTQSALSDIRAALYAIVQENQPMTVRQIFYQAVSTGIIAKTEGEYKNTVIRQLGLMRREKQIPFAWIADSTRWMRKPRTHSSLESMLQHSAETYRRDLWDSQDCYVEIWLEKEALAGVLYEVTAQWDVPLMVTRGYPSLSYLYAAAQAIQDQGRPCFLYYFGDMDPSGLDIPRKVEHDLREFAPDVDLHFRRVAVTREQIDEFGLQTRPTKMTDSRFKHFQGESVEVDAMPPVALRSMVSELIEQHIDPDALARLQTVETAERDTLRGIMERLQGGDAR